MGLDTQKKGSILSRFQIIPYLHTFDNGCWQPYWIYG